ncbi:MAG: hypothetical protein ACRECZ_08300, partial [Methylocella sp.]
TRPCSATPKGALDIIAAVGKYLLEMPVGDSAIEIDIDTKEVRAGFSAFDGHGTKWQRRRNFFRHTACANFERNSVLM